MRGAKLCHKNLEKWSRYSAGRLQFSGHAACATNAVKTCILGWVIKIENTRIEREQPESDVKHQNKHLFKRSFLYSAFPFCAFRIEACDTFGVL